MPQRLPRPASTPEAFETLAALCEPPRRDLYFFVAGQGRAVSRDEAARAMNLRRGLVAHHLDRLADDGLLEVEYRRLTGRSGPGAGRPSKLYRVAPGRHELSVPASNHRLMVLLLVRGLAGAGRRATAAVLAAARDAGEAIAAGAGGKRATTRDRRAALIDALRAYGYAPKVDDGALVLTNCPYEPLPETGQQLVCRINEEMICAAVDTFGFRRERCVFAPAPGSGRCCVRVAPWPETF